jgi:hypothetical protein
VEINKINIREKETNKDVTTAMKAELNVNGNGIEVIIDSGAGPNVISNKLRKGLGIPIKRGSKERCTLANGQTIVSLGKIDLNIELDDDTEIVIEAEVIESNIEDLIIGNDALSKMRATIDYKEKVLILESNEGIIEVPVNYLYDKVESEDDELDEGEDSEYEYEEGDKKDLYTIVKHIDEDDNAKEIVLAQQEERH